MDVVTSAATSSRARQKKDGIVTDTKKKQLGQSQTTRLKFQQRPLQQSSQSPAMETLLIQTLLNTKDTYTAKDVKQMQQLIDELNLDDDADKLIAQTPLDQQHETYPLGWWAALALGKLGQEQAVMPLIEALRNAPEGSKQASDSDENEDDTQAEAIARAAAFALTSLGAKAVQPLIEVLTSNPERDMRQWAAIILGQIGDTRAVQPLIQALYDLDTYVRSSAAGALGQIGDTRAVQPLIETLQRGPLDGALSYGAALSLARIGTPEAIDTLRWTQNQLDSYWGNDFWAGQVKPEVAKILASIPSSSPTTNTPVAV